MLLNHHLLRETVLCQLGTLQNILCSLFPGSTLAAVSESVSASRSQPTYSGTLQSASSITLAALGHAGTLMRSLMHLQVRGQAPISLSAPFISTVGFHGDPDDLLCTNQAKQSNHNRIIQSQPVQTSSPCQFHIPTSFTAHLKSQKSEVVQVLFGLDAELGSNPLLSEADPPISTTLVAMELATPQGKPIAIQDLYPEQAIQVTLPNKYPVELDSRGGDSRVGEAGNGTCLSVTLPTDGSLNLSVKAVDVLDENEGLYISFNFSLDPGKVNCFSFFWKYPVFLVCLFSELSFCTLV